jgi:HAD superfamily hydrolase (TIGR01509 family)
MIKLIIFDLWRTLIPATIDFDRLFSLVKKTGLSKNDFIEKYEKSTQLKKYYSLIDLKKDFFDAFNCIDVSILEKEFYEIYHNRFDKINFFPDVEHNLSVLKKDYLLALLSNTESLQSKKIEDKLNLKKYFDFLGYSFDINYLKPDKRAFDFVLKKFDVKPFEALMIGDSLRSDIMGSKSAGLHSVLIDRKKIVFDYIDIKPDFVIKSFDEIKNVLGELK